MSATDSPVMLGTFVVRGLLNCARWGGPFPSTMAGSDAVLVELTKLRTSGMAADLVRILTEVRKPLRQTWRRSRPTLPPNSDDDSGRSRSEVDMTLREVRWRVGQPRWLPWRSSSRPFVPAGVTWHASTREALHHTLREAESAKVAYANLIHLAAGVLADENGPAAVLLARAGHDRVALLDRLRATDAWACTDALHAPMVGKLTMTEEVNSGGSWLSRRLGVSIRRSVRNNPYGGALGGYLEDETLRQAVRTGTTPATLAHLVLAIASLDAQLTAIDGKLQAAAGTHNDALQILHRHGVTLDAGVAAIDTATTVGSISMSLSESMDIFIRPSAYWSRDMADVQHRAVRLARERNHPQVGLSHVLAAALDTTESPASRLLAAVGTDPAGICAETLQTLAHT